MDVPDGIGKKIIRFFDSLLCAFLLKDKRILCLDRVGGLISNAALALLYLLARECPAEGDILEIGSFKGRSAVALCLGNRFSVRRSKVWLVEPFPRPDKDSFLKNFKGLRLDEDIILVDKSSEEARKIVDTRLRMIFIDGDHRYEVLKKDIILWSGLLQEGGIIALHDFRQAGSARAIKELIVENADFSVCGTVGAVLYASKGKPQNAALSRELAKLNKVREGVINLANLSGLSYLLRGKRLENN